MGNPHISFEEDVDAAYGQLSRASRDLADTTEFVTNLYIGLYVILAIINIVANLSVAFVIIRYKQLRLEKSNILILNIAILHSLGLIFVPVGLLYAETLYTAPVAGYILLGIEVALLIGLIFIIILLTVYWLVKLYHPQRIMKFNNYLNLILICVYLFIVILSVLLVCVFDLGHGSLYAVFLLLVILILFVVVVDIVHFALRRKLNEYKLATDSRFLLVNTFALSKLPLIVVALVSLVYLIERRTIDNGFLSAFFLFVSYTATVLAITDGTFLFAIMYKFDRDYNAFFKNAFCGKCSRATDGQVIEQPVRYVECPNQPAEN